ncbi:thiamine pyrophosphate-binding protein [Paraburkholderia tropica]|uniref:thiamine pyrophosphate-binding protein n=1 Tax=Paraburkholderia tropica TaxID=92647 RepID=UPI003016D01E
MNKKLAGHLLIESLIRHGSSVCFGVPGESFLGALDGMYEYREQFQFIACRQEGGAAYMAEAYGKLTGQPGICFVTRGPGATNASVGVHTAFQDSTPMIVLVGQIERHTRDREAFQEVDLRQMFAPLAKWVAQIDDPDRIPEYIARAYQTATTGRQGPVVLALPEDMLVEQTAAQTLAPYRQTLCWPAPDRIVEMQNMLRLAQRPLAIVGGSGWTPSACAAFEAFSRQWSLPVACAFRFQDTFDNRHPNYAGEIGSSMSKALGGRIQESDLILAVGVRLGEGTTRGYTLVRPPRPVQKLIHIHPGAEELGSVYQADLLIQSALPAFGSALAGLKAPEACGWSDWSHTLSSEYQSHSTIRPASDRKVDLAVVAETLQRLVPENAVFVTGAGNYAGWFLRYIRYRGLSSGSKTQLAPANGSMGYGVPAAVAAKIAEPERVVISISGDGCFMMNGQELATARQYGKPMIFIVVNNSSYGTIRMFQERHFSERVCGTQLMNPDFAMLAQAYGMNGHVVEQTEEFEGAIREALSSALSTLIEIRTDVEHISAATTLSDIKAAAA